MKSPYVKSVIAPARQRYAKIAAWVACSSLVVLIALLTAWEVKIAPLRPGGSWLLIKILPLCLALPGILKQRLYTYQWMSLLVWLYLAEGVVRGMSDPNPISRQMGWIEVTLAFILAMSVMFFARLHKTQAGKL